MRLTQTACDHLHGATKIKPGDIVEYKQRDCRVIEVYDEKLKVYYSGGMQAGVKKIWAEGVTDYRPRE